MRVYRCNPRCYNAISRECRCQCNGANHGVGETRALENSRRLGFTLFTTRRKRVTGYRRRRRKTSSEQGWLFPAGKRWATSNANPGCNRDVMGAAE